MRNSIKEWCTTDEVDVSKIDFKVNEYLAMNPNANIDDVCIVMSPDLYKALMVNLSVSVRGNYPNGGAQLARFNLSSGGYPCKPIPRYRHFLFIGTEDELRQYEFNGVDPIFLTDWQRRQIDKEFEDIILAD